MLTKEQLHLSVVPVKWCWRSFKSKLYQGGNLSREKYSGASNLSPNIVPKVHWTRLKSILEFYWLQERFWQSTAQSFVGSAKEYGVDENIINCLYCLQRPAMCNVEQADSYHSSTEEQANYLQTHKSISYHQNTSNKQSSCSHKRRSR